MRSQSPARDRRRYRSRSRSRSRSPRRSNHDGNKPRIKQGFKWKDKNSTSRPSESEERSRKSQHRHRDHRDSYRDRDDYGNGKERERRRREMDRSPEPSKDQASTRDNDRGRQSTRRSREDQEPTANVVDGSKEAKAADEVAPVGAENRTISSSSKKVKEKRQTAPQSSGLFMTVKVNDRLGTTTVVPCLPSDNIGDFKKLVAMRIGRRPHEIMLKRQGERPFRDMLTLEDYGVGNGAQLDLELDTGD